VLGGALSEGRYTEAGSAAVGLRDSLRQHVIDEESKVLKLLIDVHGRAGVGAAIRTFQRHRAVHHLLNEIENLARSAPESASGKYGELAQILQSHFGAEKDRIFPWP